MAKKKVRYVLGKGEVAKRAVATKKKLGKSEPAKAIRKRTTSPEEKVQVVGNLIVKADKLVAEMQRLSSELSDLVVMFKQVK